MIEETNDFVKYDLFENNKSWGPLKDRYIFDFSMPFYLESEVNGRATKCWTNLSYRAHQPTLYQGTPGVAAIIYKDKGYDDSVTYDSLTKIDSVLEDIKSPYWDKNAIIYTDEMVRGDLAGTFNSNTVKTFRSGYIEFTMKTESQNSIIACGSDEAMVWIDAAQDLTYGNKQRSGSNAANPVVIDNNYSYIQEDDAAKKSFHINLKNGKIELVYSDPKRNNKDGFTILGNITVADNNWHHIVVNIARPGTIRDHVNKFNKKYIEVWVDGQLDIRTDKYINNNQTYFPLVSWLFMDPLVAMKVQGAIENGWNTVDYDRGYENDVAWAGLAEFNNLLTGQFHPDAIQNAFTGSIHTFVSGINYCLNKYEIQQRNRLWRGYEKNKAEILTATSEMVQPTVSSNKKKALKLFWNNLIDNAKNGIELDSTFSVHSYSVTNQTINSSTEIHNVDIANSKEIKFLSDVRVVMTDNVFLWGPGKDSFLTMQEQSSSGFGVLRQENPNELIFHDGLDSLYTSGALDPKIQSKFTNTVFSNLLFSGVTLNIGDRILLTNQFNKKDNGIYTFNGLDKLLTRSEDSLSASKINNAVVRVIDGKYKDTSWMLSNTISSLNNEQLWTKLEYHPDNVNINTQPLYTSRWTDTSGDERFIDLEQDINISNFDLIVFMNYPETMEEINENFPGYSELEVKTKYLNFIKSLENVCAQGANLYISSPKLALDLGIVKNVDYVDQLVDNGDAHSASISPFEINEDASRYFDTHRINQYKVVTEVPGLTDKETYILTDFINYIPENVNDYEQYHAKYSYRQFGLREGNEFFISSLSLRQVSENDKLPGLRNNNRGSKPIPVVEDFDLLAGTPITQLQNTYYNGNTVVTNPHNDDITTIIVHNGQILNGQPINGKIFVNFVEDGYTLSREEYNKAVIQVVPSGDTNETTATRAWQYSTTRLNRQPRKINIRQMTEFGQTTPTNGGGGPLIQATTNSSNGIIRSESTRNNLNYQSDLYTDESEEIYSLQEIPVLSMTWLGLQWLAE